MKVSTSSQSDICGISSPEPSSHATDEDDESPLRTSTKGKRRESSLDSNSSANPARKRRRLVKSSAPGSPHSEDSDDGSDLLAELDADRA